MPENPGYDFLEIFAGKQAVTRAWLGSQYFIISESFTFNRRYLDDTIEILHITPWANKVSTK